MFSLENISLGADARVPFLGDAMTVGFHFCSKDAPFRLTVMCVGGGGWLGLRASPKGLVLLELGLEACASLSIDLGVASGSVSISVGVYLRLEADKGLLTAYFRIRGEVDVLGLISASITLELSLTYHFDTGKLIGRASLVVEVEVLFFSASVEITVERKLAGSKGDPTLFHVMPPDAGGLKPTGPSTAARSRPCRSEARRTDAHHRPRHRPAATRWPTTRRSTSPSSSPTSSRAAPSSPTSRPRRTGRPRWRVVRLTLSTSLGVDHPLRVVSAPDAAVLGRRTAARAPRSTRSRRPRSRPRRGAPTPRAG